MDLLEYKNKKSELLYTIINMPLIKKYKNDVIYWDTEHSSIDITVDGKTHKGTFKRFLENLKEKHSDLIQYAYYNKNSYSSHICIRFKNNSECIDK